MEKVTKIELKRRAKEFGLDWSQRTENFLACFEHDMYLPSPQNARNVLSG